MNNCAICGKTNDLFDLAIPDDDGGKSIRHVCGKCWGVIVHIALRAVQDQLLALSERIEKIEDHEVSPYEAAMLLERAREV